MATLNWIPPLPPGFEARWDPNQRAYFYINHNTKQTSWTDPRPQYYASQSTSLPQANQPSQSGHPQANQQRHPQANQPSHSPANQLGHAVTDHQRNDDSEEAKTASYRKGSVQDQSETRHSLIENIVKNLQKTFPSARYDVIRDTVFGCNNNEASAKARLENMGYKAVTMGTRMRGISTASTKSQSRSPSPSPAKKKYSEEEKRRITLAMMAQFHDLDENYIKMGLETVNYDEAKFKRMVQLYRENNKSSDKERDLSSARKKVDDEISFKPAESLVPESFSGGMEPVVFGNEDEDFTSVVPFGKPKESPKQTTSKTKKTTGSLRQASPKQTDPKRTTSPKPSKMSPKSSNGSPRTTSSQRNTPSPTREGQTRDNQATKQITQPRAKQITQLTYTHVASNSQSSTHAKGPDPSLRKGPNKEHLLTEHIIAKGPNPDHYTGPDTSRVHGSQGACGPDPSLVCGTRAGSAGSSRGQSLVTAT